MYVNREIYLVSGLEDLIFLGCPLPKFIYKVNAILLRILFSIFPRNRQAD